jgi:peroxiredoxin
MAWGSRCLALFVLAVLVRSAAAIAPLTPPLTNIGQPIDNFVLRDAAGKSHGLHDLKESKAIVVVFLSFECPMCSGYAPTLAELARTYAKRGVVFVGVGSDPDVDAAELARQAQEYKLPFAVWPDARGGAADALGARVTPEVFVLDGRFILRYRGRIDDGYLARLRKNERVRRHDLRQALDEVLSGAAVSTPVTEAIGCPLPAAKPAPRASGAVTFYRDVLPIVQERCQGCHRPGEVGPFALLDYRQAVRWADDIKDSTRSRRMPPWKPVAGREFLDDRRLSDKEIATLSAWVDGGTPAGDPKDAPPPRRFPTGWQLGEPDCVLKVDGDFQLAASGPDVYRCFVLPTRFAEDRYVTAVEVRPGNRRIAHHAILFVDRDHRGRRFQDQQAHRPDPQGDAGPGYTVPLSFAVLPGFLPTGGMSGWAPGLIPRHLPEGTGFYLPRGADIVLQMHYHRNGRVESDRTAIGLHFARKHVDKRVQGMFVPAAFVSIPEGVSHFRVTGSMRVRQDCHVHAIIPHMHLVGKEIRVTMTPPGGKAQLLVAIDDWDFNWQETYFFRETLAVKAGTRFDIEGTYDNSDRNPANPFHPPQRIFGGLETTNEMCVAFLAATPDVPATLRFDVSVQIKGLDWLPQWSLPAFGL